MTAIALALATLLSSAPPDSSPPAAEVEQQPVVPDPSDDPPWEIYTAVTAGFRTDFPSGGGTGAIGVNRRLGRFVRPELMLGLGAYAGPTDVLTVIRVGARIEYPNQTRWKPYLWLAFAHNHETPLDTAKQAPVQHVLGLSEDGVNHRSGFDAGLGVTYVLPRLHQATGLAGRVGARAVFTQMLGKGPPRMVDFTLTAGVSF